MTEATELPDFIEQALAVQDDQDEGNPFAWRDVHITWPRQYGKGTILRRWLDRANGRHRRAADGASQTR